MVFSLAYRRPAYVKPDIYASHRSEDGIGGVDDSMRSERLGIPAALSFDKIMSGRTCPPCTLNDFMDYMIYVEHSAENLKFYIWLRGYTERFNSLNESSKMLSPEHIYKSHQTPLVTITSPRPIVPKRESFNEVFKGTVFDDPFRTPRSSDAADRPHIFSLLRSLPRPSTTTSKTPFPTPTPTPTKPHRTLALSAYAKTGTRSPFATQPFRAEISRIISTYLLPSSPYELNLSSRDRTTLLAALDRTTHPSAFLHARTAIEGSLRQHSHPNFVRWAVANANPARLSFAWWAGLTMLVLGTLVAVLCTLSRAPRGYRVFAAVPWVVGGMTMRAAREGVCAILLGWRKRQVRPWEMLWDGEADVEMGKGSLDGVCVADNGLEITVECESMKWARQYGQRGWWRRVFDRQVGIVEPCVREVQDTLFVQSLLIGLLGAIVATGGFVALPSGGFF